MEFNIAIEPEHLNMIDIQADELMIGRYSNTAAYLQRSVDRYFDAHSEEWSSIYEKNDLQSSIYKSRQAATLDIIDRMAFPKESKILEIGCGAGVLTIALAHRGYRVIALDSVNAMVNLLSERAKEGGVEDRIIAAIGDVHDLQFADQSFDAVLALGVLPWLHSPLNAMKEMARVVRSKGTVIVTMDNKWRLNETLDPRLSPAISGFREEIKSILLALKLRKEKFVPTLPKKYSISEFDAMITGVGVEKIEGFTLGFGPFTMMGKRILPDALGKNVNGIFQRLADSNVPLFRGTGSHYIFIGRRI